MQKVNTLFHFFLVEASVNSWYVIEKPPRSHGAVSLNILLG